jgi:hypothetical protein
MMTELRKLWHLLDANGNNAIARYIRSVVSVKAYRLSMHLDNDD